MSRVLFFAIAIAIGIAAVGFSSSTAQEDRGPARNGLDGFNDIAAPFLKLHCVKCHGSMKPAGNVRLDDLTADVGQDIDRWLAIREQVRDGAMPPEKESRPDSAKVRDMVAWISGQTSVRAAKLPNQGNLLPHELLFGKPATAGDAPAGRLWRLSPDAYLGFVRELGRGNLQGVVQPFSVVAERGIKDFAGLYTIDEPSAEILLRNSELIAEQMTDHEIKDGKVSGKNNAVREIIDLFNPKSEPSSKQLEAAVHVVFKMALNRPASSEELTRFLGLYAKCDKLGNRRAAVKTMVQAVLLRTDAVFRIEMGQPGDGGRRILAGDELVRALSLALNDRRDQRLGAAAQKDQLKSRPQIAEHVRRILDGPANDRAKIQRFFREYFDYGKCLDLFKDKPKEHIHVPTILVADTDRLIQHIYNEDKDVFRQLLTTELTFANYASSTNKKTKMEEGKSAAIVNPNNDPGRKAPDFVYGFESWPKEQPAKVPEGKRLGILMQPAWLIAHATNFDNDPVRRGRWIRERLLGGTVPELPIGVAAQVPDDKHRTFRDRLSVTRDAKCWKCHRMMDDLGLPFEQFNDFGVHRTAELVLDVEATAQNVDKRGKKLGPIMRPEKLDATGKIADSNDEKLDGPVADPYEMVRRIATSDRARQVFIRHAFRFFLGRNETLADAKTLQDADRAYLDNGGSFKAVVVALLTSDSFLCRK